jgi:hypothetical protein
MRPKIAAYLEFIINESHLDAYFKKIATWLKSKSTYGHHKENRIREEWFEATLRIGNTRDQHLGVYTENEVPVTFVLKTTARNETRLRNLLDRFPNPVQAGGYYVHTSMEYR